MPSLEPLAMMSDVSAPRCLFPALCRHDTRARGIQEQTPPTVSLSLNSPVNVNKYFTSSNIFCFVLLAPVNLFKTFTILTWFRMMMLLPHGQGLSII